MKKNIPESLRDHVLPFDWDTRKVWALKAEPVEVPCAELAYLLALPLWSSVPNCGMLFDTCPMDIIRDPSVSVYQHERIRQADLQYPVDILLFRERRWILDGVHRIAKHIILGNVMLCARLHHESVIQAIKV